MCFAQYSAFNSEQYFKFESKFNLKETCFHSLIKCIFCRLNLNLKSSMSLSCFMFSYKAIKLENEQIEFFSNKPKQQSAESWMFSPKKIYEWQNSIVNNFYMLEKYINLQLSSIKKDRRRIIRLFVYIQTFFLYIYSRHTCCQNWANVHSINLTHSLLFLQLLVNKGRAKYLLLL